MSLASMFGWDTEPKKMIGVHLVDFSQIVISSVTATFKPTEVITLDMMRHVCLNTLRSNIKNNKDRYPTTVLCVDNKDGYWRREVAYYYKKHRKAEREKSEWDWETIFQHLNVVVSEIKENMPYLTIDNPNTEADDVIGVLVKHISEKYPSCKILITSSDGDFTQLHEYKNVKQWSPILKKWVSCKHGSPRNDLRYKIIKGDKKDCIASIKSPSDFYLVGEVGARSPAISTEKFLNPLLRMDDPLESDIMTDEQKSRYKENEILLDFNKIPDYIRTPIIERFENEKPNGRSKLYPYFVSRKLVQLSTSLSDF